jgi:hypothetical protein
MRRRRSVFTIVILLCAVFGGIIFLQNRLSAISKTFQVPPSMAYLPESEKIRPWLLGFHTAFADYLWIKTTLYFGSHLLGDHQFPWLVHMVDIVTRLNPNFYPAFEFGGLLVPEICNNPNAGRIILERGVCAPFEKKWKLYFYLGMLHYKYFNDYEKAALCIATAAQLPGAPKDKLSSIAESMDKKAASLRSAEQFMYSTSENPEVRRFLGDKIKKLPLK